MSIAYRMVSGELDPFLTGLIKSIGLGPNELRPPLERWGKYFVAQIPPMFRRGGRGPVKWPALAASTKEGLRVRGNLGGSTPLLRTGGLMRSIRTEGVVGLGGTFEQHVFTDHPLARIHQDGAIIPAHEIRPRTKKALRFRAGGQWVTVKKVSFPGATIPERPILFITKQDEAEAIKQVRTHVLKLVESGWKYVPRRGLEAA